jgi:LuxR family maltose regulon positive regulatory protein
VPRLGDLDGHFLGIGGRAPIEAFATLAIGLADLHSGDVVAGQVRLEQVLDLPGAQYLIYRVSSLATLAFSKALTGHGTEAAGLAAAAIDLAERGQISQHVVMINAHLALTRVALDRLDLADATFHLQRSEELAGRAGRRASLGFARLLRCERTSLTEGAPRTLDEISTWTPLGLERPIIQSSVRALEARQWMRTGDGERARRALTGITGTAGSAAAHVDLALCEGDVLEAHQLLEGWRPHERDLRSRIEHGVRSAAALGAEEDMDAARHEIEHAVVLAEAETLRLPFIEVPGVVAVLRGARRDAPTPFVQSILAASNDAGNRATAPHQLITDREREVLGFLPTRMSNADIAAALFLSINTVKSHVSHLYTKLDVSDRDAAIAKATQLGLL